MLLQTIEDADQEINRRAYEPVIAFVFFMVCMQSSAEIVSRLRRLVEEQKVVIKKGQHM